MEPSTGKLGNRDGSPQPHPHCAELPRPRSPPSSIHPPGLLTGATAAFKPPAVGASGRGEAPRVDRVGRWPPTMRTGSPWRPTCGSWPLGSSWKAFFIGGSELGSNMFSANHLVQLGARHGRAIIQSLRECHQVTYVGPGTKPPARCSLCTADMVIPNFAAPPVGC